MHQDAPMATLAATASAALATSEPDIGPMVAMFDPTAILQLAPAVVSLIYWIRVMLGKEKPQPPIKTTKLPGDP
jgi:hypothetical protein